MSSPIYCDEWPYLLAMCLSGAGKTLMSVSLIVNEYYMSNGQSQNSTPCAVA